MMGKKFVVDLSELGRLGGFATAAGRTPKQRSKAARKAANVRWAKKAKKKRKVS